MVAYILDSKSFSFKKVGQILKKRILIFTFTLLFLAPSSVANAHGGGLDSQGGHNCRVGSCAGTYHCHQPRGPVCQEALGVRPPSAKPTPKPTLTKKSQDSIQKNKSNKSNKKKGSKSKSKKSKE